MASSKRKKSHRKSTRPATPATRRPNEPTLDELLSAVRLNPDDLEACFNLAGYYLTQGEHDRIPSVLAAVQTRQEGLESSVRTKLRRLLAFGFAATREYDRAEECIERGIEEAPNTIDLWFVRGYVAMAMGNFASAVIAGDRYLELLARFRQNASKEVEDFAVSEAHEAQLLNIAGSALLERRKFAPAIERFEAAIGCDPGNHLPYLNLIRVYEQQGQQEEAHSVCQRGLKTCRNTQELRLKAATMASRASICACLMVKNEEEHLPRCLNSIRNWVDKIVVVDTGSTDRTVEIARSYGAQVYHHAWEGDFSKHRNQTLEYATGDWILVIDADEEFVEGDVAKLRPILDNPEHSIVSLNVFNVYTDGRDTTTFLPSIRLFRRSLNLHYDGIVHNQLVFPKDTRIARVNAAIRHYGYGLSPQVMARKIARTRALLEKQLAATPDSPFALFNYAQLLRSHTDGFTSEHADLIIDAASKAVSLTDPADQTERHLHLMCLNHIAWCHFYKNDFTQALALANQALAIRSDYLDPLFLLGHVYSQQGNFEAARSAYVRYLQVQGTYDPSIETENLILLHIDSRASAWYGLAICEDALDQPQAARNWLRKIVELRPGYLDAASRLGQFELAEGKADEARRLFRVQLDEGEPTATALLGLAYVARMQGENGEAEYYYRQALDLDESDPTAMVKLVQLLLEQERHGEAIELLQCASCEDASILRISAQAYYQAGQYDRAIPAFERLLTRDSQDSGLLNDLANCYARLDNHQEAEKRYREALEADPAEVAAARNLGVTLIRLNRPQEAVRAFEQSLRHNEQQPAIYHILGDLFAAAGDYGQALTLYERVLTFRPADSLALFRVSECYLVLGHKDAAKLGFARVLEGDPRFEPARQRLASLAGTGPDSSDGVGPSGQPNQKSASPLLR